MTRNSSTLSKRAAFQHGVGLEVKTYGMAWASSCSQQAARASQRLLRTETSSVPFNFNVSSTTQGAQGASTQVRKPGLHLKVQEQKTRSKPTDSQRETQESPKTKPKETPQLNSMWSNVSSFQMNLWPKITKKTTTCRVPHERLRIRPSGNPSEPSGQSVESW